MKPNPTKSLLAGLVMAAILLISACKKDEATGVSHLVASIVDSTSGISYPDRETYTYDTQGRVVKLDKEHQAQIGTTETWHYVYTYSTNTVTENVTGTSSWNEVYDLNAQGYYSNGGLNEYNSDGRMTVQKIGDAINNFGTQYTYQGGNAVQARIMSKDTVTATLDNTFDTSKEDTRNYGNGWQYGEGNKHLVTSTSGKGAVVNFVYDFDTHGRVAKETSGPWSNGSGTGVTRVRTFTYVQ